MHPRLIPGNAEVALVGFETIIQAKSYVVGQTMQVDVPVADVLRAPGKGLDRQLLFGAAFEVIDTDADTGYSFGRAADDGYVGYVQTAHLTTHQFASHRVQALSSHLYSTPDVKSLPTCALPFAALVLVTGRTGKFSQLSDGRFIPEVHLEPVAEKADDFVSVFERFVGVPYLWGGDSIWGMDCSGAVQLAIHATGQPCPRDSDMQLAIGAPIARSAPLQRGDLIFWAGHVGAMTDEDHLIHANASLMAVTIEPLPLVAKRAATNGDGDIIARRRL